MIIITGAAGFIGSVTLGYFNKNGITDIAIYDKITDKGQIQNLAGKTYNSLNNENVPEQCEMVIHIGANANTLETNYESIYETNIASTKRWAKYCLENKIPMIFTSTAAIFGNGDGALNLYAESKLYAEDTLLRMTRQGLQCAILRLFNVYGPNEYHKGRMASTIFHWYNQLQETQSLNIFENSNNYSRDFIYVEDVAEVILRLYKQFKPGVYEVGTGNSTSFETVANTLLSYVPGQKNYISMPDDLKKQYQTHTHANVTELNSLIDSSKFKNIHDGIGAYLSYLNNKNYF